MRIRKAMRPFREVTSLFIYFLEIHRAILF